MRLAPVFLVLALLASAAAGQGAPPSPVQAPADPSAAATGKTEIDLDRDEITVGDRVEAVVRLLWEGTAPEESPRFPAWQETWGQAEVLDAMDVAAFVDPSGRQVYEQKLTLTAFQPGNIQLPALEIVVPLDGETVTVPLPDDVQFTVASILPETPEGEALEPRAPAELVDRALTLRNFLILVGLLAAGCILAVVLLARRLGDADVREALKPRTPRLDPLPELLATLGDLDAERGCEPVHTGLSLALRHYLGRRLAFPAVESTTSEIQRQMRGSQVPIDVYQRILELLRACDQVKFARLEVDAAVIRERLDLAPQLAQKVEQAVRPPEPVIAEEAA